MKIPLLITGGLVLGAMAYAQDKPNIIIILADDVGFSDIGCFGGEIQTPVLDKMAKEGMRMTQMYNSARSCPSRANLLTGLYPHQTGLGHMDAIRPAWPKGYAGFRSNSDNVTIAEVLKDAGYFTAMSGKWHLGRTADPVERGFQEYYGLLGGFNSFWNPEVYSRLPEGRILRQYKDGEFYATNVITDYAIDFINQAHQEEKPLFMYLAYNAPHFPLHAPKEVTDKYMQTYLQGWDKIRDQRWKRIVDMKLMQGKPELSPRGIVPESLFEDETHPLPAWNSLTKEQQADLARRMAIYAAMVDIMDANIGRVLETLQKNGALDNTFIMFMSDNGACAEWHEFGFDKQTGTEYHTHTGEELDRMGLPGTYHHYGTGWANVCCTPFSLYKHYAHEGGISTPCIIRWGDNIKSKGGIDHQPAQFSDIMSTCIELAGTTYPDEYEGRKIIPTPGRSVLPIIRGTDMPERYIYAEHEGNRMVRKGDWKLVSANFKGDEWELYNIKEDRTELHNLIKTYPKMAEELENAYFKWADKSDVLYFPKVWNTYNKGRQKDFRENKLK
ncbi:arylsulfatase [Dysgonomonas termitidis]|uniref:Arylsulfatase n=1 Tax=Dysgonomonas termitidis TaxID=1516126 RepID=A0ABV9KT77_9BACT